MAEIGAGNQVVVEGSNLGTALTDLLCTDEIQPGSEPSYQACRTIYLYHPLGAKMAESPVKLAQSQKREITIKAASGIEERLKKAFDDRWQELDNDATILNQKTLARVYGITTVVLMAEGVPASTPIDYRKLHELNISFNVLDPLNTAGSLVLDQNPNSINFQKPDQVSIAGTPYHRSRALVVMNEKPIYISYTSSGFGFVGRSVYQRALFPLKSFIASMVTDDMVVKKAGLLIAMIKTVSSAVDKIQKAFGAIKRNLLKTAVVGNVLQIGADDKIETLNMQNLDGAFGMARKDILENIAVSADMPAVMLNSETFAQGFADGSEDAKNVAHYIDRTREEMRMQYAWFDLITMHQAWSPNFYKTIQAEFPERYGKIAYEAAFYEWKNSFSAAWPNLLTEPDSEKVRTQEVKLKGAVAVFQVTEPICDPVNKATLAGWLADTVNSNKEMFPIPLVLDLDLLEAFVPPEAQEEPAEPKPFSAADSVRDYVQSPSSFPPRQPRDRLKIAAAE
jgi:hypothetical protein